MLFENREAKVKGMSKADVPEMITEWSPSFPGAGTERATALLELYCRWSLSDVAILVVDSLTRHFRSEGASVGEMSEYLGLTEIVCSQALAAVPKGILCTSLEVLPSQGLLQSEAEERAPGENDASSPPGRDALKYFINYRSVVPFVHAHFVKLMQKLCRLTGKNGLPSQVYCNRCKKDLASQDFLASTMRCNACKTDAGLVTVLAVARSDKLGLDWEKCVATLRCLTQLSHHNISSGNKESSWRRTAASKDLNKPQRQATAVVKQVALEERELEDHPIVKDSLHIFRRDPCVLQQVLAMMFFFSEPFVFVDKLNIIIDPRDIMTVSEWHSRCQHRSSLAQRFRAVHRSGQHIRVDIVNPTEREEALVAANVKRLRKRKLLPPWLVKAAPITTGEVAERVPLKRPRGEVELQPWERAVRTAALVVKRTREAHLVEDEEFDTVFSRNESLV